MISKVPTVEQLVQAAIGDADSFEVGEPPVEKIASTKAAGNDDGLDLFEKTARELESWADQAESNQEEFEKVASAKKEQDTHDAILKLAMASTVLHTLHELDEHGQLGRLVEKNECSNQLTGRERVLQLLGQ
ncbi:hypothetical protein LCGC14_0516500 [marine sediment metagenome]|uniref:Uncharacterized protein n=1 Tax=marine sediment metagenome TaxID=412755 RepID=A0A0F9SI54_9ZZZZ